MINDADFDTEYPESVDDHAITDRGANDSEHPTNSLLAMIHVARSLQSLPKHFKEPFISDETIRFCEGYINNCLPAFPKHFSLLANEPLDPSSLTPLIYLQNVRLMLYRHNLSPFSPPDLRLRAIDNCITMARDTAHLMSRCMASHDSIPADNWRQKLASSATTMLCTHLWRCTLLLLFRSEFALSLTLVRASVAINDSRAINTICGRYLSFFLSTLHDRLQGGQGPNFDQDEELLAYASGDLQASADGGWIWQEHEIARPPISHHRSSSQSVGGMGSPELYRLEKVNSGGEGPYSPTLSEAELSAWGGWERVEGMLQYLIRWQNQQHSPHQQHHIPEASYGSRLSRGPTSASPTGQHVPPRFEESKSAPPLPRIDTGELLKLPPLQKPEMLPSSMSPSTSSPNKSRMTIANII